MNDVPDVPDVPMDAVSVGTRVADAWLEGTDQNSVEELVAAIHRLAQVLGNSADEATARVRGWQRWEDARDWNAWCQRGVFGQQMREMI